MSHTHRVYPLFLAFSLACAALSAQAFPIRQSPAPLVEFYNQNTRHYFATINAAEIADLEAGKAGPGWVRTGVTFDEYAYPIFGEIIPGGDPIPVSRFYAPGPNTHFFTLDASEAESLKAPGSGWIFEGIAFLASPPAASGSCAGLTPIYRLYNNRFAFNDSNHRFVTEAGERARMVAEGWIDEGVKMCTSLAQSGPLRSFAFDASLGAGKIQPSATCEDESKNLGACMALNNLAPPTTATGLVEYSLAYGAKTGLTGQTFVTPTVPVAAAPTTVFVQQWGNAYGVHVDTIQRGPAVYTSVNPLYQFKTSVDANGADARVFPFRQGAFYKDAEISVKFIAYVKTVNLRNSVSAAYGHPTIEFIDQRSGKHLYFTALTYSNFPGSDYLAPDVATGKVIVGTTFRNGSPYLRNFATWAFETPSGFTPPFVYGLGGPFEFRMNRDEFLNVLKDARSVDAALSANPDDYLIDNFHFNNEVYGDGEIGMNIAGFRLEIVPRGS